MKKTLFVLFLLLTLPMSQTVANKIEIKKFQNATFPILPIEPIQKKEGLKNSVYGRVMRQQRLAIEDPETPQHKLKFRIFGWMLYALFSEYWLPIILMALGFTLMVLAYQFTFPFVALIIIGIAFQIGDIFFFFVQYYYDVDYDSEYKQNWVGTLFWLLGFVFADLIFIGFMLTVTVNAHPLLVIGIILGLFWFGTIVA
jgi:hypothetical protein